MLQNSIMTGPGKCQVLQEADTGMMFAQKLLAPPTVPSRKLHLRRRQLLYRIVYVYSNLVQGMQLCCLRSCHWSPP